MYLPDTAIPPRVVIASNNKHKVEEIRAVLCGIFPNTDFLRVADVMDTPPEIDEFGTSLEENAYIKAKAIQALCGLPCIADDTGLEVNTLSGAPGVYSARYAGAEASDALNRSKLLGELAAADDRSAAFRTVLCWVDDRRAVFAEGECRGAIAEQERGSNGFGYDAIFVPEGRHSTFAEMAAEEKLAISHRSQALLHLREVLTLLQS